jgi:putative spermidine/putrescine transport system permease protein
MEGLATRIGLRVWAVLVLLFLFVPIAIIALYAFNSSNIQSWPIHGLSTKWFSVAWNDPQVRSALVLSLKAGGLATAVALVLGSAAAFGVHRFRFFGREAVSLVLVLPLALPGIITGIALNSAFQYVGINLSLLTIVIGHATFCIVVVYNNVVARLRRTSGSFEEASADLGADPWQTFRFVTFPSLRSALGAGALLAFALSFDEIIVTNFTIGAGEETLPIWIYRNLFRPKELPVVPAVAAILIVLSIIPVYLAHRLSTDDTGLTPGRGGGATTTPVGIAEAEATAAH